MRSACQILLLHPWKIVANTIRGERLWSPRVHRGIQEGKLSRNSGDQGIVADELKGECIFSGFILYAVFRGARSQKQCFT